jgi:hypothetical protein
MMLYHLLRSEVDSALDWYERDIDARHPVAAQLSAARFYAPLHAHPRWRRIAAKMNLPTE